MRCKSVIRLFAFSALLTTVPPGVALGQPAEQPQEHLAVPSKQPGTLQDRLEQARETGKQPGMAAVLFSSDGILESAVSGVRQYNTDRRVEPGDAFHIGSVSKPMTATLVAILIDEGTLRWDMTLAEVFADLAPTMHEDYKGATITQLLGHRAGVPSFTSGVAPEQAFLNGLEGTPTEQRAAFVARLLAQAPATKPGSTFSYSNGGYGVLSAIIERVTGQSWEQQMQEKLFNPLGMTSAGFGWPASEEKPDQPLGHFGLSVTPVGHPYRLPPALAASGDIHCSVEDLARFGMMHLSLLRGGAGPRGFSLKQETVRMLHTPHAADQPYAQGWVVRDSEDGVVHWHNGSAGTFFCFLAVDPKSDRGAACFSNSGSAGKACQNFVLDQIRETKPAEGAKTP